MVAITSYGDISPAVAAWSVVKMLERAMPLLTLEKFGQTYPLPTQSTQTAKFRRYYLTGAAGAAGPDNGAGTNGAGTAFSIPTATTPLTEGVTPSGTTLTNTDYTVQLYQYGNFATITDVIIDTHTDPVLAQMTEILGENAATTVETLRFNVLKAGTNVWYQNNVAARVNVVGPIALADQRRVTTGLNRQNAKKITKVVASTPAFNTTSVEAAYVSVAHPDLESDIRNMTGFIPVAKYGPHTSPWEGEIGSVEQVRYLTSTIMGVFASGSGVTAAATSAPLMRTDPVNTSYVDVYPILYFARDAYGIVPLKGKSSMAPMVVNPKPAPGDPLGQRGTVGWKLWTGTVILQDAWMARLEVCATA